MDFAGGGPAFDRLNFKSTATIELLPLAGFASLGLALTVRAGLLHTPRRSVALISATARCCMIAGVLDGSLGASASPEIQMFARIEQAGGRLDRLVRTEPGPAFDLVGVPFGALIRWMLRDAAAFDARRRGAETRIETAEATLGAQNLEHEALQGLIAEVPIIAGCPDTARARASSGLSTTPRPRTHGADIWRSARTSA